MSTRQTLLTFQPVGSTKKEGAVGMVGAWKFDHNAIRSCVTKIIIIDELPIRFVEGEGFRNLMSAACPHFKIPSR